ncbi:hypothetical protein KCP74_07540 [Salmonella enterica subsp. enterica]|nr:hypothetical protein KCP74_07540 [Salmonella enterica subsp. enterica]
MRAATEVCGAQVNGDELGSGTALHVYAGADSRRRYRLRLAARAVVNTLVLQTVLPALWFADGSSRVEVHGGTHNRAAPSADFICRVTGTAVGEDRHQPAHRTLIKHGFYPADGGASGSGRRTSSVFTRSDADIARRTLRTTAETCFGGGSLPRWRSGIEVATLEAHFPQAENVVALEGGCGRATRCR